MNNKVRIEENSSRYQLYRIMSAIFYGIVSLSLTLLNKQVLHVYKFPFQILGFGQMFITIVVLFALKKLKFVSFPDLEISTMKDIFPLPLLQAGNMIFGLGGTRDLTVPTFTALRKFPILFTMAAEYLMFKTKPSLAIQLSVYTMIVGAIIAAVNDLSYSTTGYIFIFLNNIFTAASGVYTKKKLNDTHLGKLGLMYYNSLFMIVPIIIIAWLTGDVKKLMEFNQWNNPWFLSQFLFSCCLGLLLFYSQSLCIEYTSALTTGIIGGIKNILLAYIGMFIDFSYKFDWWNFMGINISSLATAVYTYIIFRNGAPVKKEVEKEKFISDIESGNCNNPNIVKHIRGFDLSSHCSNVSDNRIVTGLKFVNLDGVISIQIQDGKLVNGSIDSSSLRWNPPANSSPEDDSKLVVLNGNLKSLFVDTIVFPKDMVVVGVQFSVISDNLVLKAAGVSKYHGLGHSELDKIEWIDASNNEQAQLMSLNHVTMTTNDSNNSQSDQSARCFVDFNVDQSQSSHPNVTPTFSLSNVVMDPKKLAEGVSVVYEKKTETDGIVSLKLVANNDCIIMMNDSNSNQDEAELEKDKLLK